MNKKYIHKIIREELQLALESCGYTHTTKGKKLKTPGGTNDKDIKKEASGVEYGMTYMNKHQSDSNVGTIKAADEDPSDEHSQQSQKAMNVVGALKKLTPEDKKELIDYVTKYLSKKSQVKDESAKINEKDVFYTDEKGRKRKFDDKK